MKYVLLFLNLLFITPVLLAQEFKLVIAADKNEYILGEPIYINMYLANKSTDTISYYECLSLNDTQYKFKFTDSHSGGVNLRINTHVSDCGKIEVQPQNSSQRAIELTYYFSNTGMDGIKPIVNHYYGLKPENYSFQMTCNFSISSHLNSEIDTWLTSNELKFTVLPITSAIDSTVFSLLQANNTHLSKMDGTYKKVLDSAAAFGFKTKYYEVVLWQLITLDHYTSMSGSHFSQEKLELLEKMVNAFPKSQYSGQTYKYFREEGWLGNKEEQLKVLLKDNPYLNNFIDEP